MNPEQQNPYNNGQNQPQPSQTFSPTPQQGMQNGSSFGPGFQQAPQSIPQPQPYSPGQVPSGATPPANAGFKMPPSKKHGFPWGWVVPIVVLTLLLLASLGMAYNLFNEKEDYKNNSDEKVATAVESAKEEVENVKEAEFLEREKQPYKVYKGPATFGSLNVTYPKSWSAMVEESGTGREPLSGIFHPNFVPGEKSKTAYALRVEVIEQEYEDLLKLFEPNAKRGVVKISAYKAPKVPSVLGSRIDGEIAREMNGSVVLLPLRDKTVRLTVESQSFMKDFNDIILKNFVFTP